MILDPLRGAAATSQYGGRKGGLARDANRRRRIAAETLIAPVLRSVCDHESCDPALPESLCAECADLLGAVVEDKR
jgi:hypothetical protein